MERANGSANINDEVVQGNVNTSFSDGLRHHLGSIRTGTRQAYREKLLAESLLKQLRVETLEVLNKCRAEIDGFKTCSKSRLKFLSQSSNLSSYSGLNHNISIDENQFSPRKPALQSDEYIRTLENKVAELTLELQQRDKQERIDLRNCSSDRNASDGSEPSAPANISPSQDDKTNLLDELDRYKSLTRQSQRELKISTNELQNLRETNKALLRELSMSRQEGSTLRVRVIELEGLLEGLQQRSLPESLLQINDGENKAFNLIGSSTKRLLQTGNESSTSYLSASPIKISREPNSTSKEISQLLASVDLVLSASPQRSSGERAIPAGAEAPVSVQLMSEFMDE